MFGSKFKVVVAPVKKSVYPRMIAIHAFFVMRAEAIRGDMSSHIVANDATLVNTMVLVGIRTIKNDRVQTFIPFFVLVNIC